MKEFSTEVRLDPGNSDAQNNLGALLAQEGNLDEAIRHTLEALRLSPVDVRAHINLSNILITEGDVKAALDQLHTATESIPGNPLLLTYLGRAQFRAGLNDGFVEVSFLRQQSA